MSVNPLLENDELPFVPDPVLDPAPDPVPDPVPTPAAPDISQLTPEQQKQVALTYAAANPGDFPAPAFDGIRPAEPVPDPDTSWIYDPVKADAKLKEVAAASETAAVNKILGAIAPLLKDAGRARVLDGVPEEARQYVGQIETELDANFFGADPRVQGLIRDAAIGRAQREGKMKPLELPDPPEPGGGAPSYTLSAAERTTAEEYFKTTGIRRTEAEIKAIHKEVSAHV